MPRVPKLNLRIVDCYCTVVICYAGHHLSLLDIASHVVTLQSSRPSFSQTESRGAQQSIQGLETLRPCSENCVTAFSLKESKRSKRRGRSRGSCLPRRSIFTLTDFLNSRATRDHVAAVAPGRFTVKGWQVASGLASLLALARPKTQKTQSTGPHA